MHAAYRRRLLLGAGGVALMSGLPAGAGGWPLTTPEAAGFDAALPARFAAALVQGALPNLHGLVLVRGGAIAFEHYGSGADNARGRPLGKVAFGPATLHDLRSVTKSIVGLLYGIALAAGQVPPPEAPLLAQFPAYGDLAADPARARWTLAHVLSMTLGTAWDESLPYTDARNSEIAMDLAPDRLRFVLDRPILAAPGERWGYNGGATALLGALIARGSGRPLHDYARAALFDPLGIGPTEWATAPDGVPFAASGLRMAPRDLARIGQMMLQGGAWRGHQVVPRDWLEARLPPVAVLEDGRRYDKHWYIGRFPVGQGAAARLEPWVGAIGNGGQRLFILPGLDLVVAIAAGNYNAPDQGLPPLRLMREVILASLAPG